MGKRQHKNHFWYVFNHCCNDFVIDCNSAFSDSDNLPLVQHKYSLNTCIFSWQPETATHNIKWRGNYTFSKVKCIFFENCFTVTFFPVTSPVSKTLIYVSYNCFVHTLHHLQVHVCIWINFSTMFERYQLVFQLEAVNS